MESGAVRRPSGQLRLRPSRIVGDKAYSAPWLRRWARSRGISAVVPRRNDERRTRFNRALYRERHRIEIRFNRFKHLRRLATRYEKLLMTYENFWILASVLCWTEVLT